MLTAAERRIKGKKRKLDRARKVENDIWVDLIGDIQKVYADGEATMPEIAGWINVTKARIFQLVTGKRAESKKKDKVATASPSYVGGDWAADDADVRPSSKSVA